jgi:hypothetical protein
MVLSENPGELGENAAESEHGNGGACFLIVPR